MCKKKPILFYLCGLPASGKSTKAVQLAEKYNANIHSSDKIREEILGDVYDQKQNSKVFSILHGNIFSDLYYGKNVVYDATNVTQKNRIAFLNQLRDKNLDCIKICIVVATPYEDCLDNNKHRDRKVPEEVIIRMYKSFTMPSTFEGFDSVEIYYSRNVYLEYNLASMLTQLRKMSHDNPHHTLTIGDHMMEAYNHLCIEMACNEEWVDVLDDDVRINALMQAVQAHDIGKGFTKSFMNSKDNITDIAYYYQHHCVGAYDSMFYFKNMCANERIRAILLVNHHMKPYEWKNSKNPDKAIAKFVDLYGIDFYEDLMLLHKCDILAH